MTNDNITRKNDEFKGYDKENGVVILKNNQPMKCSARVHKWLSESTPFSTDEKVSLMINTELEEVVLIKKATIKGKVKEAPPVPKRVPTPPKAEKVKGNIEYTIFNNLRVIQCKIEKKGKFNYVSWTDAWEQVKLIYPNANFKIHTREDGFPAFIDQQAGGFVKVTVTIEDLTHTEYYPILNNMNKVISSESIRVDDINNSIKRCLVKCLAFFGLGLYVYQGEDLPSEDRK